MMKIKKPAFSALFLAISLSATASFATIREDKTANIEPTPQHINTTRNIVDALSAKHYVSKTLNDSLSAKIFNSYLSDLDPSKSYFLASDINRFEQYRLEFDTALRRGDVSAAYDIFNVYHRRVIHRFEDVITQLEAGIGGLDFTIDEALLLDREEESWAKTEAELDNLWRKRIKNAVLNLKLTDKEPEKIQELLLKRYKNRLARTKQTNSEDVYQLFMNSFTAIYDPHTQYFSPRTSENFNINMSLTLEGIGAVLQREDEYTRVVSLVPAGPADKSKQIYPDDRILAVGQGVKGELVDVVGWRLDEVVQLIRGKKDTIVKLNVVKGGGKDSDAKIIEITRNTVKLEEQSAKAEVIEIEQFGAVQKIGVIDIPTFYVDFRAQAQGRKDYKSTTRDVTRLLKELEAQDVDGVIIDLRNNGGGSLQEARTMTGLFIDRGPTVQVRSKSNRIEALSDHDIRTIYDGPLAVLVNRLSASASEIFAGAMQDYERGLIVGSQTFGKGTVQSLLPLNQGQLKLTLAKYYRISGESTQHKGIMPDVTFPGSFDPKSIGESTLDAPLPWDKIGAIGYRTKSVVRPFVSDLQALHQARTENDPEFQYLKDALVYRQARSEINEITLNEKTRIQEKDEADAFWVSLENKKRVAQGLPEIKSLDELDESSKDSETTADAASPGVASATADESSSVDDSAEGIAKNAVAGVITTKADGNAAVGTILPATALPKSATSEEATDEEEKDKKPDPFLIETGKIVLDWVGLNKQTAQKRAVEANI